MSEKAMELARAIRDNQELIRLGARHRAKPLPDLIDAAVAPLVELAEAAVAYIAESPCDPDVYPEQREAWLRYLKALGSKALAAWRE